MPKPIVISQVLEYLSTRPDQVTTVATIMEELGLTRTQVQKCLSLYVKTHPRQRTIRVDVSGNAWTYIGKGNESHAGRTTPIPTEPQLKEGEDYLIEEATTQIIVAGRSVDTNRISQIWLVESGESEFLCNTCKVYHSPNIQSVLAHHGTAHPVGPTDEQIKKAFGLLPIAVAQKLLARVGYVKS